MKTMRNPATVHHPLGPYAHQIEVVEPVRWLVLSGQLGQQADGRVPDDPVEQLEIALDNIRRNLDAAGMTVADILKLTIYLVGEFDAQKRREALVKWLGGHTPCMTLLFVAALAAPQYRVEISGWACAVSSSP
jgi:2-iminobutanoate/2-iminopropanoate deaminase